MTVLPIRRSGSLALVGGLHVVGWGVLLAVVVPLGIALGRGGGAPLVTVGIGLTAYALGLRHAFDPDHIAAIDNTTRRLVSTGQPARTVGLWFSLGHSTVVVTLCVLLTIFGRTVSAALSDDASTLHIWTSVVGPVVSGVFLLVIAGVNLAGLRRDGHSHGGPRGPVVWLLSRFDAVVDRPSRMYGVGLLFGLGFDTATEIGLLVLAGSAATGTVPWWAVLTLPVLFTAGMSALDGAQGLVARRAYGAATPRRRHTLVITLLSVAIALVVAVVELSGVVSSARASLAAGAGAVAGGSAGSAAGPLARLAALPIGWLGFALTAVVLGTWVAATVRARRRPSHETLLEHAPISLTKEGA